MSTIRGVKDRRFKFVQLLNSMFEDLNLSLKAKGFIGFCLTKTEDWKFHISHLCSVLKEGETAIYSVINECIENGYAYRYQARDKSGRMLPCEFVISDSKLEISTLKMEFESRAEFKKSLPNRENQGTEPPHPENPGAVIPRENPVPIYSNTNNSNTREQQQDADVFSKDLNKEQKPKQSSGTTGQLKSQIYENLKEIDIPEVDKTEITSRHDETIVKNAIAWAIHPETKLNKGLSPAIKWACQNKQKPPKNSNDEFEENKAYAKKYDGMKNQGHQVNVLNTYIEIYYGTGYKEPFILKYTEKAFKEQLESALRKSGFRIL